GTLISLPFFIISGSMSHKAALINAQIKLEKNDALAINLGRSQTTIYNSKNNMAQYPAVSLKVNIGK
ncbi:MAG: hypothetical protein ACO29O_03905, partial [Chitinophagaceae bacterium]